MEREIVKIFNNISSNIIDEQVDEEIENNNSNGAVVNFENGSLVEMKNGIVGTGTVNIKGGTLKGKITGSNVVNFNNGTWNLTGDSVVAGVVSDGDVTINGIDGNSLTVNNTITEKGKLELSQKFEKTEKNLKNLMHLFLLFLMLLNIRQKTIT